MADLNEVIQIGSLPVPLPSSTPVTAEPKKAKSVPEPAPAENFDIPDEAYLPEEAFDPPPDNPHRRREIIQKIGAYKTLFPTQLIDIDASLKGIDMLSVYELESLLGDVQFMVESRQSTKMSRGMFLGGITMLEGASPLIGLRLEGLSNMAAQSSNLLECVDETYLKYAPSIQDPRHRLGIEFIRMCYTLDAHNRAKDMTLSENQQTLAEGL
jgi:hypothetical protein